MAEIIALHKCPDPIAMLQEYIDDAKAGNIASLIIITKNPKEEILVHSMNGTSAVERAGMCAYAQKAILDSLEPV